MDPDRRTGADCGAGVGSWAFAAPAATIFGHVYRVKLWNRRGGDNVVGIHRLREAYSREENKGLSPK